MKTIKISSRYLRISPRKIQPLAGLIKKKPPTTVVDLLEASPQKGSRFLLSLVKGGLKMAQNQGLNPDLLEVQALVVNQGPVLRRRRPGSRGRAILYKRPTSHLTLVLSEKEPEPKETKTRKPEAKE